MSQVEALAASDTETKDLETKFRLKLMQFCEFLKRYGLEKEPYSHLTWPKFRSLSPTAQHEVYSRFSEYSNLCTAASESGVKFTDDRSMTWWALQCFGLRPCSDFFDKLTNEHVVEIYNTDFIQIYRNWEFFKISSYTMGDLFVFPWPDLYVREIEVTNGLISLAQEVLAGGLRHTVSPTLPRHVVSETLSTNLNVLDMELNYVSPLFDSDSKVVGFFAVSSVTKIGKKAEDEVPTRGPALSLVK